MGLVDKFRLAIEKFRYLSHSAKGKDLFLYLMCVVVSFLFWLFLSLDGEVQRDYEVPVRVVNIPQDVKALDRWPENIAVTVQGKGMQFIAYSWGEMSPIKIPYNDYVNDTGVFRMTKTKIESKIHDYFGQNVSVLSTRPDSIVVHTTTNPGKKVRLVIDADITPSYQSILSGPIVANVDSVTLYSAGRLPSSLDKVVTEPIKESGLTDTTYFRSVKIKPVEDVLIVPSAVDIMVPVEPLISKKKVISINVLNVPEQCRVILFPYSVEVSYLVPISKYNSDMQINAFVNYRDIKEGSKTLDVTVTAESHLCRSITYSPQSVEYVVEYFNSDAIK